MDFNILRLPRRNVEVFAAQGHVHVVAGFWQYGTVRWDEFYRYLTSFIYANTDWRLFRYDLTQRQHGDLCQPDNQIVQPGQYVLLSTSGEPIGIGLASAPSRSRIPVHSNTPTREPYYCIRGCARDGKCLITGLQSQTYSRLNVSHIFPHAHDAEWTDKGYPSKITDRADIFAMGGPLKIDSVQNLITLRSDLHSAWDNYEFGVDPDNNYRITAFTNGNADINGLYLQMDHIQDPTLRPLHVLFTDHFMQGIFKHMRGEGEVERTDEDEDPEDALGEGTFSLSNPRIWGTTEGRRLFELELTDRLFYHQMEQGVSLEKS